MKPNSLSSTGLSISQAQSISNLCNQRAKEIENAISHVNNFSKIVKVDGKEQVIKKERKMPKDIVRLLEEKAKLHACQAFLMENLKTKDELITNEKRVMLDPFEELEKPTMPVMARPNLLEFGEVKEAWGWEQLSSTEYNEYLEVEAFASHIGQYFHKGGVLDALRKELPTIPDVEWMRIRDGEQTPVEIKVHNESDDLLALHEKLATIHRKHEQRVNYFKAKVKNITTAENSKRAKVRNDRTNVVNAENETLLRDYKLELELVQQKANALLQAFEVTRQDNIAKYAALRIDIDPRFQDVVDTFLKKLEA